MADIYFRCKACGQHLVVDEARRGLSAHCPDCQAQLDVPTRLHAQQCPQCAARLMVAPEMSGALLHCSECQEPIRIPGSSSESTVGEPASQGPCPRCHVTVAVVEETSNRPTPCPNCGEQVYFRTPVGQTQNPKAGLPQPKGHDELRFRRRSR